MHIWDVDLTLFTVQRKLILTIEVLFVVVTGLVKVSILLFFRRLGSRGVSKTFRIVTWAAIGFTVASTIAFFISPFVGCRPISAYWEQSSVENIILGKKFNCNEEGAAITAAGVVSTVQDVITAFLPNFIYWKAQIPLRQKIALMAIFATAYAVAAFGALRTYSTWVLFYRTYDVSWQLWEIWNWTLLEFHIGVICANTPALKVFLKRYLPSIKSIVSRGQGQSSQAKSSQPRTPQEKKSQTESRTSSNPSGKSKFSKWKDPFAIHGYFSQSTQMGDVQEVDDNASETLRGSGETPRSVRRPPSDDLELGLLCPAKPAESHRGSYGLTSVYMYDDQNEDEAAGTGIKYLRVKI